MIDEAKVAARYAAFAEEEARAYSPAYADLAAGVGRYPEILAFITDLPPEKQQPNLFFAAVRLLHGIRRNPADLARLVRADGPRIRAVIMDRATQTNEPGRCAVLLPALARLAQPLALIEVGAAAGLCLLPDFYGYDYGTRRLAPRRGDPTSAPVFATRANSTTPVPAVVPEVAWRVGLDHRPVDLDCEEERRWQEALVWPGNPGREARLHAAIEIARHHPPRIVEGDLSRNIDTLIAGAPRSTHPVVFHTAVVSYVERQDVRDTFAERVMASPATWISNEPPRVFPWIADSAPPPPAAGAFLLSVDARPVAWTAPHGQWVAWFG